jgi:RimJ/RimL family protein N-acetyltransferase
MNLQSRHDVAGFDFQPTLRGTLLELRPLRAEDFANLYRAASDPLIWEQHPDSQRWQHDVFTRNFFTGALRSGSAFIISDRGSGAVVGSSRYYEWNEAQREVAIGYTFLARSHWGGPCNRELKRLMLDHALRWAERVWFHVGEHNLRSRKAMEKLGATLSGVRDYSVNGKPSPYAYYCIEREDWLRRDADSLR